MVSPLQAGCPLPYIKRTRLSELGMSLSLGLEFSFKLLLEGQAPAREYRILVWKRLCQCLSDGGLERLEKGILFLSAVAHGDTPAFPFYRRTVTAPIGLAWGLARRIVERIILFAVLEPSLRTEVHQDDDLFVPSIAIDCGADELLHEDSVGRVYPIFDLNADRAQL
jgi:hypothetical protein